MLVSARNFPTSDVLVVVAIADALAGNFLPHVLIGGINIFGSDKMFAGVVSVYLQTVAAVNSPIRSGTRDVRNRMRLACGQLGGISQCAVISCPVVRDARFVQIAPYAITCGQGDMSRVICGRECGVPSSASVCHRISSSGRSVQHSIRSVCTIWHNRQLAGRRSQRSPAGVCIAG